MVSVSTEHIEITPGVCGGKPRIAGHRITVQNIVIWHEQMGMSVTEISRTYPGITPADVHAALAYYHDHRDAIQQRMQADDEFVAEMKAKSPPSRLEAILAERDAKNDTLSPG
jgi:uncharacterized protein (DUF433 family)